MFQGSLLFLSLLVHVFLHLELQYSNFHQFLNIEYLWYWELYPYMVWIHGSRSVGESHCKGEKKFCLEQKLLDLCR